jgi:hypothetical protein
LLPEIDTAIIQEQWRPCSGFCSPIIWLGRLGDRGDVHTMTSCVSVRTESWLRARSRTAQRLGAGVFPQLFQRNRSR